MKKLELAGSLILLASGVWFAYWYAYDFIVWNHPGTLLNLLGLLVCFGFGAVSTFDVVLRSPKIALKETLPSYVLRQEKVSYATMPQEEEIHPYIEIKGEDGAWTKPKEPVSFMSTLKFKASVTLIVVFCAVIYLYFNILR